MHTPIVNEVRSRLLQEEMVIKIQEEDRKLRQLLDSNPYDPGNFFLVLRRWNSYTPAIRTHDSDRVGGGYFLSWHGKGVVIDPGLDFIRNFRKHLLNIDDIHAIVLTHSHLDHCADFESIMTLLYEYNDNRKLNDKKRVHIYANQGVLRKYSGWLDMLHKRKIFDTQIERIYTLEPFMQNGSQRIPGTLIRLKPTVAYHNEVIADMYSVGLIFELYASYRSDKPQVTIGITSDTRWFKKVHSQYKDCDLLVIHLGTVDKKELIEGKLYKKHAGALGTTKFISDPEYRYKIAIISEFGEELKLYRREIMTALINATEGNRPGHCIAGDVGTKVLLDCNPEETQNVRLMCEHEDCENEARYKDIYGDNGVIKHYCQVHQYIASNWLSYT